jgi:uncharacterized protein YacL
MSEPPHRRGWDAQAVIVLVLTIGVIVGVIIPTIIALLQDRAPSPRLYDLVFVLVGAIVGYISGQHHGDPPYK